MRLKHLISEEKQIHRLVTATNAEAFNTFLFGIVPELAGAQSLGAGPATLRAVGILISRWLLTFWMESAPMRDFVPLIMRVYEQSAVHAIAALDLCKKIVLEFQPALGNIDRLYRKKCIALRDSGLQPCLELALHAVAGSVSPEHLPFTGTHAWDQKCCKRV